MFDGRHIADFAGIPASGAHVRLPYTMFYELDGDKITQLRGYLSMAPIVLRHVQDSTQATATS